MAFTNSTDLVTQARLLIQASSTDGIETATVLTQVQAVAAWISRFAPRKVRSTLSGTSGGSSDWRIAVPTSPAWVVGFSTLLRVEYPLQQSRCFLAPSAYTLYPSPDAATHISFVSQPSAGTDNIGVDYTVPHTISASTTTIPANLQEVTETLLAHLACRIQANKTGYTTDPSIAADSVNYRSKGAEWAAIAKNLLETASALFGQDLAGDSWYGSGRNDQWAS